MPALVAVMVTQHQYLPPVLSRLHRFVPRFVPL
ncbi:hypothetical protein SBC1_10800 [Caballeronia sp. SBC1]|nr:hypothetical protein SBC2_12200 [Caballeronia sp. SBC2]QIN61095.1 hypothetical protein SBC1_10800 [Caballeronia sp. SBC1]